MHVHTSKHNSEHVSKHTSKYTSKHTPQQISRHMFTLMSRQTSEPPRGWRPYTINRTGDGDRTLLNAQGMATVHY